uniref:YggS family pyridoxal phosphate-dependent enzyme n=1 Tax=Clostridium sp. 12(A) TaxID=1163671 RepID=UPI000464910F|nr:YggS family pyridoxal phosphate-dependent enzyme [Clostridium sp. 12(A)]
MILENLEEVNKRILSACEKAGRDPKEVTLIAVSKTKPASMIEEAYGAGVRDFGENKAQELCEKYKELPQDIKWHMIGHLQRNKVKQIIGKTVLIHSVDSLRLAEQIEEEAGKQDLIIDILLEINVAEEDSKFGFKLEEAESAILKIATFPHVRIKGLMTIAPFVEKSEENRSVFKKLRQFYVDMQSKNIDNVNMSLLSMGMTGDYEVAIEEGATLVRVGTGIFGTRYKIGENEV